MARKEKGFSPGQMVLIMDMGSGREVQGIVCSAYPFGSSDILVEANGEKVSFNVKTLRGKTVFGSCILRHIKA
ncbi:hypothetical protein J7J13_01200 [bacterium]|nr:hypothetical protein [bacterium]